MTVAIPRIDEPLLLDSDKALVLPARRTLIVADTHFGKDARGRADGLAVPEGSTEADLNRLSRLIQKHDPTDLWILGDVFDSPAAEEPATIKALQRWRENHHTLGFSMVPGNHDRQAISLAAVIGCEVFPEGHRLGPWTLFHHPGGSGGGFRLCGHLHPGAKLLGPGRDRLTLPCFWKRKSELVLPAFGALTGLAAIQPRRGDRIFVVVGDVLHTLPQKTKAPGQRTRRAGFPQV